MKILYIEDNPQNIRLIRKMLHVGGYNMVEAPDGKTGIQVATSELPDLILIDANLTDTDGVVTAGHIKANPQLRHIPVIALTASTLYDSGEQYLKAGCDGYLTKPVSKSQLIGTLTNFLGIEQAG